MEKLLFIFLFIGSLAACKSDAGTKSAEASIQSVRRTGADEIITDAPTKDTSNVAKMTFVEDRFNFGTVDEGDKVKHIYEFTNTGDAPLVITNAKSTCGCTVPVWPKEPVAVGAKGTIEVSFNTAGKTNNQMKPVTIIANTYPAKTVVYLTGFVTPAPREDNTSN